MEISQGPIFPNKKWIAFLRHVGKVSLIKCKTFSQGGSKRENSTQCVLRENSPVIKHYWEPSVLLIGQYNCLSSHRLAEGSDLEALSWPVSQYLTSHEVFGSFQNRTWMWKHAEVMKWFTLHLFMSLVLTEINSLFWKWDPWVLNGAISGQLSGIGVLGTESGRKIHKWVLDVSMVASLLPRRYVGDLEGRHNESPSTPFCRGSSPGQRAHCLTQGLCGREEYKWLQCGLSVPNPAFSLFFHAIKLTLTIFTFIITFLWFFKKTFTFITLFFYPRIF